MAFTGMNDIFNKDLKYIERDVTPAQANVQPYQGFDIDRETVHLAEMARRLQDCRDGR